MIYTSCRSQKMTLWPKLVSFLFLPQSLTDYMLKIYTKKKNKISFCMGDTVSLILLCMSQKNVLSWMGTVWPPVKCGVWVCVLYLLWIASLGGLQLTLAFLCLILNYAHKRVTHRHTQHALNPTQPATVYFFRSYSRSNKWRSKVKKCLYKEIATARL